MIRSVSFKNMDAWKFRLLLGVKLLITACLIYYLNARFSDISLATFLSIESSLPFIIAVSLVPLNFYLQFKKWQLICDFSYKPQKKSDVFISILTGISTGLLTPGRLGEYPGRAFPLKEVRLSEVTAGAAIDKLNSLLVILIGGSFAAIIFLNRVYSVDINLTVSLLFLLTGVYLMLLYLMLSPEFWRGFVGDQISKFKLVEKYFLNFRSIGLFHRGTFAKNFAFSVGNYFVFSTQFFLLLLSYSSIEEVSGAVMGIALVFFTKSIIPGVTFGEIGIRESAAVFFIGQFGVSAGACFNAALMLYTINVLIPSIPGAIFIFRKKK
ncbi:MAG: flippase-like domain-containing protein [Bacteroidetes bacterium]|nr:flippase-like domain-containing protein [Bacteroidota bacterium]